MTIEQRIIAELGRLNNADPTLHSKALMLHTAVEKIIHQLKAHLGEISTQMKEYDKHDASHSEKVLENIEKLLRDGGIGRLSLLEAMTLRLCCYFHDSGMILPECYLPLLEDIEWDSRAELPDDLQPWLKENRKTYDVVQDQFYCPDSEEGYEEFLTDEMDRYQKYRLGLPEDISGEAHFRRTRHDYLRHTHGERAKRYAENLTHFLEGIPYGGRSDLAEAVGLICASHCQEITEVRKLETCLEIIDSCPDMACNVRYLAMLLRLGDVIHFSSDRASRTVYAERAAMDADSEIHWKTKFEELEYAIRPKEKGVSISYSGCFEDPKAYYFLQSHLDRVDEELRNYAAFVSDMHDEPDADRYSLGLPTNVFRDAIRASRFTPDPELKFRLEHRKIITLLMGMRLYRDEFMCLRELYQNALDACRCMRAENQQKGLSGELKIEFGLSSDRDGDYLYCKDEGTGMTMDIVKNYLLRIGNSYYQSDEFRRSNAQWGDAVAPVSEFGIGLLSCYMIASRIEVITRHHTLPGTPPIWVCMEDSDDYGYFRTPGRTQEKQVGLHGTYVKLYLKEAYKEKVTGYLPDCPEDAVYELGVYLQKKQHDFDELEFRKQNNIKKLAPAIEKRINSLYGSLYYRIMQFIQIPDVLYPVYISNASNKRVKLSTANKPYILAHKLTKLTDDGFGLSSIFAHDGLMKASTAGLLMDLAKKQVSDRADLISKWMEQFAIYHCAIQLPSALAEASAVIHLPCVAELDTSFSITDQMDQTILMNSYGTFIDGIPVGVGYSGKINQIRLYERGIQYNFCGTVRPRLTVDRGAIRDVPEQVGELTAQLRAELVESITKQIETHFNVTPDALSYRAKIYMLMYFQEKFPPDIFYLIMKRLSLSIYHNFEMYGNTMHTLLFREHVMIHAYPDCIHDTGLTDLLLIRFTSATHVALNERTVSATISENTPDQLFDDLWDCRFCLIATDEWKGIYSQYDVVTGLRPFVPRRLVQVCDAKIINNRIQMFSGSRSGIRPPELAVADAVKITPDPWDCSTSDALLLLEETLENRTLHQCRLDGFIDDGKRRYVIYSFITPHELNDEEKTFSQQYAHIPEYIKGVQLGWSVLYYRYKDGYVIAPGIVDRMEMLKLLPDEALNHDDGLEYYFTDGTRAF